MAVVLFIYYQLFYDVVVMVVVECLLKLPGNLCFHWCDDSSS